MLAKALVDRNYGFYRILIDIYGIACDDFDFCERFDVFARTVLVKECA